MKQNTHTRRFLSTLLALCMVISMFSGLTVMAGAAETYTASLVTSSEDLVAGGLYMFVQEEHAMINVTSSNAIQTTTDYALSDLAGTESYVWRLNTGSTGTFTIQSAASDMYIKNSSSTSISLTTSGSNWAFGYTDNSWLIQNLDNSSRFLGYSSATSYAYKAYATNNLNSYPHAIQIYKLNVSGGEEPTGWSVSYACSPEGAGTILTNDDLKGLGEGDIVTLTVEPNDGYEFTAWDVQGAADYTVKEDNSIELLVGTENITVTANFKAVEHTVMFVDKGSELETRSVAHGNVLGELPTVEPVAGYSFRGWTTADDVSADGSGIEYVDAQTPVTDDMYLYAVYAVETPGEGTGEYEKATSIAVGDTVVLVCETAKTELTSISDTPTKYGVGTDFEGTPAGTYPLKVVEGSANGSFAFETVDGTYLYWDTGTKNTLNTSANLGDDTSWNVEFDVDGNATIKNVSTLSDENPRVIMWNKSSPRFACYSGQKVGNSYYAVQLYKKDGDGATYSNYTLTPTATTPTDHNDTDNDGLCDDCGQIMGAYLESCSVTLGGQIGVNYYMSISEDVMDSLDQYYMEFQLGTRDATIVELNTNDQNSVDLVETEMGMLYRVTFKVNAAEMTETITAHLCKRLEDGTILKNLYGADYENYKDYTYSVQKYADYVIEHQDDNPQYTVELTNLAKALLNYGGKAQRLFNKPGNGYADEDTNLADFGAFEPSADELEKYKSDITGEVTGLKYYGASLLLESNTSLRIYFELEDGYDIKDYLAYDDDNDLEFVKKNDKYYYVEFSNIGAGALGNQVCVNVMNINEDTEVLTIQYSPLTYVRNALHADSTARAEVKAVATALYNYYSYCDAWQNPQN